VSFDAPTTHHFYHRKEIVYGSARVLFVEPLGQLGHWVFPGGGTTQSEAEARATAVLMDRLIGGPFYHTRVAKWP
jgi:hypothetical protein